MPSPNPDLTTRFDLPSPIPSDPPDVPGDIKALADRVDAVLGDGFIRLVGKDYQVQSTPPVVPTSFADVATVTGTTKGGPVLILAQVYAYNAASGDWRQINVRLRQDSTSIYEDFYDMPWDGAGNPRYEFTKFATEQPSAGSHTWALAVSCNTAAALRWVRATVTVLEVMA